MKLADSSLLKQHAFLDGQWVAADAGATFDVLDPATGERLASVPDLGAAETERAIRTAEAGQKAWAKLSGKERAAPLRRWFELMVQHADDLAMIMTREQGKPLAEAKGEVIYAASFIECVRRHGKYRVFPADNRVLAGIQKVSALLQEGKLLFSQDCADSIREFSLYRWSEEGGGEKPVKENDHAMDEIRYFAMQVCGEKRSGFFAIAQQRGTAGAQSTNKGGR